MTNLQTVLPDLDVTPFSHILPNLERANITTADLLTLDALDIAKRAQVPPGEVRKLDDVLIAALNASASVTASPRPDSDVWQGFQSAQQVLHRRATISTLDDALDSALGGGIACGHVTEIVGESAVGKTQFLLTLLLGAQLPAKEGAPSKKSALYISTEAPLQTTRLAQILKTHPKLAALPPQHRPSLSRVQATHIHDVEAQEHILRFQVPVAVQKHNVGLVIVDSIAANYRAEFDKGGILRKTSEALAQRNAQLAQLGGLLRNLAKNNNIAVVVANQVADRFTTIEPSLQLPSQSTPGLRPASPLPQALPPQESALAILSTDDPLALDHQQRFFTGWGDDPSIIHLKTPSLGLTWTNQLATRIALLKDPIYEIKSYAPGYERNIIGWNRSCNVVFSASAGESNTPFEIWEGGIRTTTDK